MSLDPEETFALNILGYIYMKRKEYTKALEYFRSRCVAAGKPQLV